ncbi:hypothetical protein ACEWY4_017582 [Coilia grayii]|uniref:Fibrinogen C-terminal domain-containing protein n=1 Tax=Coilia grayii TaxID=363190 RepID=A0ABD1JKP7_9TELE
MKRIALLLLLFLPALVEGSRRTPPFDCADYYRRGNRTNGVYPIYPSASPILTYCELNSSDNPELSGGWTVFQRRVDGTLTFYRPWQQYEDGFGDASGEYWLGLKTLHQLTAWRTYQLRVDMGDFEGSTVYAFYSAFYVSSKDQGYTLSVSGFSDGGAGDSLSYFNGMKFSTFDMDQDRSILNCAASFIGAFWYNDCLQANPNGVYLRGINPHNNIGVTWNTHRGVYFSMKSITMLIRPVY